MRTIVTSSLSYTEKKGKSFLVKLMQNLALALVDTCACKFPLSWQFRWNLFQSKERLSDRLQNKNNRIDNQKQRDWALRPGKTTGYGVFLVLKLFNFFSCYNFFYSSGQISIIHSFIHSLEKEINPNQKQKKEREKKKKNMGRNYSAPRPDGE